MSETKIIDALQKVAAPDLTPSDYGRNLKQQFENIDYNFRKLGNYDFIKGEKGSDLKLEKISIFESGTILSDLGKVVVSTILGFEVTKDDIKDIESEEAISGSHWYDFFVEGEEPNADTSNISVFYREVNQLLSDSEKEYIGSPTPVVFIDARFSSSTINRVKDSSVGYDIYSGVTDLSCALYVKYDGGWVVEKINQFPTLYYQDSMFKWKISDQESGIKAQGVPGVDGRPGKTWIGFTRDVVKTTPEETKLTDVPACYVDILYIQDEVGNKRPPKEFVKMGVKEGDSIVMIPRGDITNIKKEVKEEDPKVDDNLIFFSTVKIEKRGNEEVYVAYYNRYGLINVNIGDAWVYDTLMRIGGTQNNKNYPIPGLFLKMNPDNKEDAKAHVLYATNATGSNSNKDHLIIRPSISFENPSGSDVAGCSMSIKDYQHINLHTKGEGTSLSIKGDLLSMRANSIDRPDILIQGGFNLFNYNEDIEEGKPTISLKWDDLTINGLVNANQNLKVKNHIDLIAKDATDTDDGYAYIDFQNSNGVSGPKITGYRARTIIGHQSRFRNILKIESDSTLVSNDLTVGENLSVNGKLTVNNGGKFIDDDYRSNTHDTFVDFYTPIRSKEQYSTDGWGYTDMYIDRHSLCIRPSDDVTNTRLEIYPSKYFNKNARSLNTELFLWNASFSSDYEIEDKEAVREFNRGLVLNATYGASNINDDIETTFFGQKTYVTGKYTTSDKTFTDNTRRELDKYPSMYVIFPLIIGQSMNSPKISIGSDFSINYSVYRYKKAGGTGSRGDGQHKITLFTTTKSIGSNIQSEFLKTKDFVDFKEKYKDYSCKVLNTEESFKVVYPYFSDSASSNITNISTSIKNIGTPIAIGSPVNLYMAVQITPTIDNPYNVVWSQQVSISGNDIYLKRTITANPSPAAFLSPRELLIGRNNENFAALKFNSNGEPVLVAKIRGINYSKELRSLLQRVS